MVTYSNEHIYIKSDNSNDMVMMYIIIILIRSNLIICFRSF